MSNVLQLVKRPDVAYPPRDKETVRPFRLWDTKQRKQVQYRYYSDKHRAHMGALYEVRWAEVGTCIEVFDLRYGKLLGQYTRTATSIAFLEA
jgi:hypothetical protein